MKQRNAFLIGFFATAAFCAGLAWLGGYDFDSRGGLVVYGALIATFLSFVGGITALQIHESSKNRR
jgi:hypothetical protein